MDVAFCSGLLLIAPEHPFPRRAFVASDGACPETALLF